MSKRVAEGQSDQDSPDSRRGQVASAAAGGGTREAAAAAAASPPPKVIRGTSRTGNGIGGSAPRTKVDYLTISCREQRWAIDRCLEQVFSGSVAKPVFESGRGMRHFERSHRISIAGMPCGVILTGGETQRGRACVDLSGVGCGFVQDWERAEKVFLGLPEHSWRRADIAADFFRGELTHERVKEAHEAGKFARWGRGPKLGQVLWDEGRTLYVGKRGGDALGRFYEKGKKEFASGRNKLLRRLMDSPEGVRVTDAALNGGEAFDLSQWYRAELELRAKNRAIPDDWITRRDEYFAGAYPFLEELLPEADPRRIVRPRDMGILSIERALDRIKRQWGAVLYTGLAYFGGDYVELCTKIVGEKHSARLIAAGALIALEGEQDADA